MFTEIQVSGEMTIGLAVRGTLTLQASDSLPLLPENLVDVSRNCLLGSGSKAAGSFAKAELSLSPSDVMLDCRLSELFTELSLGELDGLTCTL